MTGPGAGKRRNAGKSGRLVHTLTHPERTRLGCRDDFDRRCLGAFERGEEAPLIEILEDGAATAGNGTHEIRNWAVAHGAAGGRGFELLDYLPAPEVYVGCAFAAWRLDA